MSTSCLLLYTPASRIKFPRTVFTFTIAAKASAKVFCELLAMVCSNRCATKTAIWKTITKTTVEGTRAPLPLFCLLGFSTMLPENIRATVRMIHQHKSHTPPVRAMNGKSHISANRTSIEILPEIYRKSIEHLSNMYRTSIEHLSNIYRNSIENLWTHPIFLQSSSSPPILL